MFTDSDLKQIENKGITIDVVNKQLENFKKGFPYINLHAPATAGNGILTFSEEEAAKRESFYNDNFEDYHVLKFVPASGAASRMFKHLHEFRQKYNGTPEDIAAYEAD
jgi:hypothetical protein